MLNDAALWREVGVAGVRAIRAAERDANRDALTTVSARSLRHPFTVRHGTTDVGEFVFTVCRGMYARGLPPRAHAVLDLGAHIGDTGAWFLSRFPEATVVSVEPDRDNYAMAARNLALYGARSLLIQAAIWHEDGDVSVRANRDWPSGSHVSADLGGDRVRAISIATLLREQGIADLAVLKCDIEGAEAAVFAADPDPWLSRTGVLAIEIHSRDAKAAVDAATARCGFGPGVRRRDVTVFTRPARGLARP